MAEQVGWVSKSKMVMYYRCPYAFFLVDTGRVKWEEAHTDFQRSLVEKTVAFQEEVKASALPVVSALPVPAPTALPALEGDITIIGDLPTFKNNGLRILGRPNGIELAKGALYPIEVQFHKDVQHVDKLRLAFCWMLLQPKRKRDVEPEGRLVLCRNWEQVEVSVPLVPDLFTEVHDLLADVRRARKEGVELRICGCSICGDLNKGANVKSVLRRRHLSAIWGIDRTFEKGLRSLGCDTWDSLLGLDPEGVVAHFRQQPKRLYVSARQVESWQLHARCLNEGTPMLAEHPEPFPRLDHYIVLDLEYDNDHTILLVGAAEVGNGLTQYHFWWAVSPDQEEVALQELHKLLNKNPKVPVVTWSGKSADIPVLEKRAKVCAVPEVLGALDERHVDMFQWAQSSFRMPVPGLDLKSISEAFGFEKVSQIRSGIQALGLYQTYVRTEDPQLRDRLLEYNKDDLDAVVVAVDGFRRLVGLAGGELGDPCEKASDLPLLSDG